MTIKVKPLGIIERFNGIDVQQSRLYINKNFEKVETHNFPIPMLSDASYNRTIETSVPLNK